MFPPDQSASASWNTVVLSHLYKGRSVNKLQNGHNYVNFQNMKTLKYRFCTYR